MRLKYVTGPKCWIYKGYKFSLEDEANKERIYEVDDQVAYGLLASHPERFKKVEERQFEAAPKQKVQKSSKEK